MIAKIIRFTKKDSSNTGYISHTEMIEAHRIRFTDQKSTADRMELDVDYSRYDPSTPPDHRTFDIVEILAPATIFIMNENGKTIDTIQLMGKKPN